MEIPLAAIAIAILGYLVALPAFAWHRRDLLNFHRPLWAGYGSRRARLKGAAICYAAFGWPELFMAFGWRSSTTRRELVGERSRFRDERDGG